MTIEGPRPLDLGGHLLRMRVTAGVFLATVPLAGAVIWMVARRTSATLSPATVTVVAVVASLWIGFSANRDAQKRLEQIRRAAAVHGDDERLLRDHWFVYVVVLLRLEVLVVGGVVAAVWGVGPAVGVWLVLLGGLMVALTWPTARKAQLLLGRVRALRSSDDASTTGYS
jgi:hypothetical protein